MSCEWCVASASRESLTTPYNSNCGWALPFPAQMEVRAVNQGASVKVRSAALRERLCDRGLQYAEPECNRVCSWRNQAPQRPTAAGTAAKTKPKVNPSLSHAIYQ